MAMVQIDCDAIGILEKATGKSNWKMRGMSRKQMSMTFGHYY